MARPIMPIALTPNLFSYRYPFFLKLCILRRKVHFLLIFSKYRREKTSYFPQNHLHIPIIGLACRHRRERKPMVRKPEATLPQQARYAADYKQDACTNNVPPAGTRRTNRGRPRTNPRYFEYRQPVFRISLGEKTYISLSLSFSKAWKQNGKH